MYCTQAEECTTPQEPRSYYQDINQITLLSAAEERELADAIARGDRDARGRMIKANLRLVVKIARDYMGRGLVLDDLVGEGNVGLIRAAEEYDPRFGTRFSTYASYWIKQAIRHALINTTATIRLPAHMYSLLTKWRRAERLLCRQQGGPPSFDEVAAYLDLSETQKGLVAKAHRARQLKLESSLGDSHGAWSPEDSTDVTEAVEDSYEVSDERAEILRRMDWLDDRERLVLSLRYGLAGEQPRTLKEIGQRLGVTREWVRKIELKAVSKMASNAAPAASTSFTRAAAAKSRARRTFPFAAAVGASSWQ
jgi:RNA polymerase primary sigma factor